MKKSIAIIGNGKVARALTLAFLKSGMSIESIIVIGRNEENLSYFKEKGIQTSVNILGASGIPNIILAVTPGGVGPQIKRLKELDLQKNQKLICVCSGIDANYCANFLGINNDQVISATINTNVEYTSGIICLSKEDETKKIFEPLGEVIFESSDDILKSVVSVGSMNAFDSKFIELAIGNQSIKKWLDNCENSDLVIQYLKNKTRVLVSEMGYTETQAKKRSVESFKSCVSALSLIQDIKLDDIDTHAKKVITRGGCTEKGINNLKTLEMFLSFEDLSDAIRPVYERTLQFKSDVMQSFAK